MEISPKIDALQLMLTDLRTRNEPIRHKAAFKGCQPEFQTLVTRLIKQLEDELNTELTRLTNAEPMRLLREERNKRLATCDWRASSDLTLSDDWKTYRQTLRDLPGSASPTLDSDGNLDMTSVTFPTEPS